MSATEQGERARSTEIEQRRPSQPQLPLYNGVIGPDKWATFGRMAHVFATTEFVPVGLRGKPDAIMACLVFGDSLGLHPSTALKEVYVADGKVGISGALMLALIRQAGHRVIWEEITTDEPGLLGDGFVGWKCIGQRMKARKVDDEDSWTYTMDDAKRAGLYPNSSAKAAWMKSPKLMCRWRALAQVARFLFSDVFVGQAVYLPDEAEEIAYSERLRNGTAVAPERAADAGADYGEDPELAAWLVSLFYTANDMEPGRWLPKKIELALKGKTQEQREELAAEVARWIEEAGGIVPERPEPAEEVEDAEVVDIDDPAVALGEEDLPEGLAVD